MFKQQDCREDHTQSCQVYSGIFNSQEVQRSTVHLKMLSGDYPCSSYLGNDRNQDTSCQLCQSLFPQHPAPSEDMVHVLTMCRATRDTRTKIIPELLNLISQHFPSTPILQNPSNKHLTQLILDPTSLNLPIMIRISPNHPALHLVLTLCRHMSFALHKDRTRQLKKLKARK